MGNLSCHVRDVLVHQIKTKAFLVNIVEHTVLCHVLKDVAAFANDLRKVFANRFEKTDVNTFIVPGAQLAIRLATPDGKLTSSRCFECLHVYLSER
jgi:hypothetical protein